MPNKYNCRLLQGVCYFDCHIDGGGRLGNYQKKIPAQEKAHNLTPNFVLRKIVFSIRRHFKNYQPFLYSCRTRQILCLVLISNMIVVTNLRVVVQWNNRLQFFLLRVFIRTSGTHGSWLELLYVTKVRVLRVSKGKVHSE